MPLTRLGNCNEDIVSNHHELIIKATIARVKLLAETPHQEVSAMTPQELVQKGFCDPVRTFVKKEPHSARKLKSKRWRLIFAISLVDQLVERLFSTKQNKAEIKAWLDCPSAPGLSLTNDDDLHAIYSKIQNLAKGKPYAEADVTGWDWSVQEWELLEEAEMRCELGNFSPIAANLCRNRFVCVANSVYSMPDGRLLVLRDPGVQLSGCYNTSSTNSRVRVMCALLAGARWGYAMGDDCVEDYNEDAPARYASLGHPLKMYELRTDQFEFCSQIFTSTGAHPADGTKTLYRLLEQKAFSLELLAQFRLEMRNSPRLQQFLDSVTRTWPGGAKSV